MLSSILAIGSALLSFTFAQTSTLYVEPNVPTGTPVPGNYTGGLRPQIHFSPPQHFMNGWLNLGPTELVILTTSQIPMECLLMPVEHGIYTTNVTDSAVSSRKTLADPFADDPTGITAGNQHWGHATTRDLYHWVNQPIAIFAINASSYIFSGSAVVDVNNTSGFFPNQNNGVVAIFTIATYAPIGLESQGIAYSIDGGYTFTMYSGNPVLDIGSNQFRDPKVIWYEDHWAMVVAFAQEFVVGIFTSPDLKDWTFASNFSHYGLLGLQYECPNLVEMPVDGTNDTMWLLQISINPGAPLGGSISQSFPGTFDGYTFTAIDDVTRINDFAKDNYAGQFFYGLPGTEAVSIAWASNWQYAQDVPTGPRENWRSAMSLPRKNSLRQIERIGYVLVSEPYDLSPVLGQQLAAKTFGNGSIAVDFSTIYSNAVYFEANVTNIPMANPSGTLNFTFISPISGEYLQGGFYFGGDNPFFINRGGVRGYDNVFFTDKFSTNTLLNGTWNIQGVFDRSMLEVFLDRGAHSGTTTFYPEQPLTLMTMAVAGLPPGNMTVSAAVYEIKSAWQQYENDQGTVLGNVTRSNGTYGSYAKRNHPRMAYKAGF